MCAKILEVSLKASEILGVVGLLVLLFVAIPMNNEAWGPAVLWLSLSAVGIALVADEVILRACERKSLMYIYYREKG